MERIVDVFADEVICEGRIPSGGPFAHGGSASCFLGVELAAQAAAVFEAVRSAAGGGRFEVPALPAGRLLLAKVRRQGGVPPLSLYSAEVTLAQGGKPLLSATFSTYAPRPE